MFLLKKNWFVLLISCSSLLGCTSYAPLPLPSTPDLPTSVSQLHLDAAHLPLPALRAHRFDPSDGLDIIEVATLAVVNNPDLKLARDAARVAHAQAFAAGLLPDPQLGLAGGIPSNSGPGLMRAFNIGISYDLNALITHGASQAASHSEAKKADLELLWQEWQVVSQARVLFVKLLGQHRELAVLQESLHLAEQRYDRIHTALAQGNETIDALTTALTAQEDIRRQLAGITRQHDKSRLDLNELLGLAPPLQLDLVGDADAGLPAWSPRQVRTGLARLARYRPDLLALQAGYQAQDQRYREAILAQFPALNVGLTRARDTSGIYTRGFSVSLTLPFLNRNRGNVAIENATRRKLRDEYRARLNKADSDVERLLTEQALLQQQHKTNDVAVQQLETASHAAEAALRAGNIDYLAYDNVRSALLTKRLDAIVLEESLLQQRVALQALLGERLSSER